MKKRLLSTLLILCMSISLLAGVSFAVDDVFASGSCGENVTWVLDFDGTLTISGRGEMEDYDAFSQSAPWFDCDEVDLMMQIVVEDGVTYIGTGAFSGCHQVMHVSIGDDVEYIGAYAFYDCYNLQGLELPKSVRAIDTNAFRNCNGFMYGVYYGGTQADWGRIWFGDGNDGLLNARISYTPEPSAPETVIYGYCGDNVYYTLDSEGTLTLSIAEPELGPGTMWQFAYPQESIDDRAVPWEIFADEITTVKIDDTYGPILWINGWPSFSICPNLTDFTVSNTGCGYSSVIDGVLFYPGNILVCYPSGRTGSYSVPEYVEIIENGAFAGSSLTEVEIPASVTIIGDSAFRQASAMTSITVDPENQNYSSVEGVLFDKGQTTLIHVPGGKTRSYTVPDGVTTIASGAFGSWDTETVTLPVSVTSIEDGAFDAHYTQLSDVYYGGTKAQWDAITIGENNDSLKYASIHFVPDVTLSTVNGAQIRTHGNQGLRFLAQIDKTSVDFDRVVEFGTVLIPSEDITDLSELQIGAILNGHAVAKVPAKNLYDVTDKVITFTAVITNIAEKNYARAYTARAYAILDDGSVIYSDAGASRTIYGVAKLGLENEQESEENLGVFQEIVDAVEKG